MVITDVDECAVGTHNCDDNCNNIDGGFLCSCMLSGYVLHMNGASCLGLCPLILLTLGHYDNCVLSQNSEPIVEPQTSIICMVSKEMLHYTS